MSVFRAVAAGVALACATPFAAVSAPVSIVAPNAQAGTAGEVGNFFPFFRNSSLRYQQVFEASEFSALTGPATLTGIAFRCDDIKCGAFSEDVSATISFSTTSASADGLSSSFADNVGGDETVVKTGSFTLSSAGISGSPSAFDIVIDVDDTFDYDPGAGNLLMEVQMAASPGNIGILFDAQVTTGDATSRVFATAGGAAGTTDTLGLVTQFTFDDVAAIPVPPALPMLGAGIAAIAFVRRRV